MKDQNAVALGRKGGKVRSDRKRVAIKENLRLAREKRWPVLSDGTRDIGVAGLAKLLSKQHDRTEANDAAVVDSTGVST